MKVVLDTNVLLAAFATRGLCESVMELFLENHEVVLSTPVLLEVEDKLKSKLRLPDAVVRDVLAFLRDHVVLVEPVDVEADACRDPNDLMVLGTAEAGEARCIVTGDKALLSLESYKDTAIVSPRQFWERASGAPGA